MLCRYLRNSRRAVKTNKMMRLCSLLIMIDVFNKDFLHSIYSNYVDILDLTAISAALWIRREILTHCYLPQFVTSFHLTDRRYSNP